MYLYGDDGLVATADFITPVCDDARRFGRVAAANSISDVYAMGGEALFALNLCCFPAGAPEGVYGEILEGAAEALGDAGAALLGGHSVEDPELKFGLAVIGRVDPDNILSNDRATPGERLLLTKPLGTGVLVNAFKAGKIDAEALEPALREMERLNKEACRLALEHGVRAATDVTGFALAGHALNVARGSAVALRIRFDELEVYDGFYEMAKKGISTGCTGANQRNVETVFDDRRGLDLYEQELLFDPQTSGGLLLSTPADRADDLLRALLDTGHRARKIGEVLEGPPRIEVV